MKDLYNNQLTILKEIQEEHQLFIRDKKQGTNTSAMPYQILKVLKNNQDYKRVVSYSYKGDSLKKPFITAYLDIGFYYNGNLGTSYDNLYGMSILKTTVKKEIKAYKETLKAWGYIGVEEIFKVAYNDKELNNYLKDKIEEIEGKIY